jgi:hypothetical protein
MNEAIFGQQLKADNQHVWLTPRLVVIPEIRRCWHQYPRVQKEDRLCPVYLAADTMLFACCVTNDSATSAVCVANKVFPRRLLCGRCIRSYYGQHYRTRETESTLSSSNQSRGICRLTSCCERPGRRCVGVLGLHYCPISTKCANDDADRSISSHTEVQVEIS